MSGKEYHGLDLGYADKLRTARIDAFPVEVYWMRAINRSDVSLHQTPKEHRHSFFELHFVLSGSMEYRCGNRNLCVSAEELLLIAPDSLHRVNGYSEDFLKFSVMFAVERSEELYSALCAKSGRAIAVSERMREALCTVVRAAERETAYADVIVAGRVFEILHEIADFSEKKRGRAEEACDRRLQKAKRFIADNAHTFLGCEDVAAHCYVSAKQLNRIFLRDEGVSLLAYIHKEKIRAAQELLRTTDREVGEISEALGFSSVYYFNTFFTKHTGYTPGKYRREVR
ncbi:MAG: AraC family transcriptional regulator [Clostridia bacterium]|nr:AraC family transcriptional regulator [Clostridia bacterium]